MVAPDPGTIRAEFITIVTELVTTGAIKAAAVAQARPAIEAAIGNVAAMIGPAAPVTVRRAIRIAAVETVTPRPRRLPKPLALSRVMPELVPMLNGAGHAHLKIRTVIRSAGRVLRPTTRARALPAL